MKLLLEIGTEELPAWYVKEGEAALGELLAKKLREARIGFGEIETFATPRRLAARVHDVAERQRTVEEERRGPPAAAAFKDGEPTEAARGFAKSAGVPLDALYIKETDRGAYLYARIVRRGRPTKEVLPEILPEVVTGLPAPRKMRWGEGKGPFVRPVRWLLALLGGEEVVFEVPSFGVKAGKKTRGHRLLAPEPIIVPTPEAYETVLTGAKVLAERKKREERIVFEAAALLMEEELEVVIPKALLEEVTDLVEWPVAVLGRFDEAYLELPDEVLATVMIHHQRFFPVRHPGGRLAPRFVGVSNNEEDLDLIREGYENVLKGRLDDAVFFWVQDQKKTLKEHKEGLKGIVFAQGLGTMWDKAERVAEAAKALAPETPADPALVGEAGELVFADLATQMVYEFPELAGTMAKRYALAEGYPEPLAQALEDAPRPEGATGPLPKTHEGAVLSIADKADTLLGFFHLGKRPKGSADPFGLRRAAFALVRVLGAKGYPLELEQVFEAASEAYHRQGYLIGVKTKAEVEAFTWDRLENLLVAAGLPIQSVRAARAEGRTVYEVMLRAYLLRLLMYDPRFTELFLLYKRAANLAREASEGTRARRERLEAPEEKALFEALPSLEAAVERLLELGAELLPPWDPAGPLPKVPPERFAAVLSELAAFKEKLDAFLDRVLVMVEDEALRQNRLGLLAGVRDALRKLGALEEIGG